jgi:gliding motility-associated-like protein
MSINSSGTLAPTGYTWTNLSTSVSTSPANGGYTVCIPGQYEAAFHDGNFCTVTTTVTIYIDTIRPSPFSSTSLPSNSYTLTCYTPSLIATANTNPMLSSGQYSWTTPPNLILSSNTVTVSMVNVTSSTSPTSYTVLAMGANGCVGRAKVNFYKDVYMPPYTAVFTPTAITCSSQSVALSPNNISGTSTPVSYTFTSPPPTQTATTAGVLFSTPGTYTMTYQNAVNGCTAIASNSVPLNVIPPATIALSNAVIPCGQLTTTLSAGTTTTSTSYSYTWYGPPLSGMSCPGGVNCNTTSVNAPGPYEVVILNTINGCSVSNYVTVSSGTINASITANPDTGFAPLTVGLENGTVLQNTSSGTVITTWNYGNGISMTYSGTSSSYSVTGPPNGSSVYQSAGSYTVFMIISQSTGTASCIGTASTVVTVELPSGMVLPNVFTPNGDGVNDVFTLQTTNLTEIICLIYDRWGVKMYDVTSDKGNIAWDGKNLSNKDVPDGTYFYFLKAKGKDLKDYEYNGTISLFR